LGIQKPHLVRCSLESSLYSKLTKPAHVSEGSLLIADAAYDWESNLEFIMYQLKAKPIIAHNVRWEKHRDHALSRKGTPICIAGLLSCKQTIEVKAQLI